MDCLLILGRDDEAAKLIKRYEEDGSAAWSWSHALLAFRRSGDCPISRSTLSRAIGDNTHVAALLLGDKRIVAVRQHQSTQNVPGRAAAALFRQVALFDQLPKVLLEGVAADACQSGHRADADAAVFASMVQNSYGMFRQA
jgi:hypothetical protein